MRSAVVARSAELGEYLVEVLKHQRWNEVLQ